MDYGATYRFKSLTLVLMNHVAYSGAGFYIVEWMLGVTISLLTEAGDQVHVCGTLDSLNLESMSTLADQTYVVDCGENYGRKVKFETPISADPYRAVLVVETWAIVVFSNSKLGPHLYKQEILRYVSHSA